MKKSLIILSLFIFAVRLSSELPNNSKYLNALLKCRQGTTKAEIDESIKILNEVDKAGILELAKCINLEKYADPARFQEPIAEVNVQTGERKPHLPTIGDVAMNTIIMAIEGAKPRGFQEIHILNKSNVAQWLDKHKNLTLEQMQMALAQQALARAEGFYQKERTSRAGDMLQFCKKNLESISKTMQPTLKK